MEWTVVGVVAALAGLIATVTGPLVRLNGNIVKLTAAVEGFKEALDALKTDNRRDHDGFNSRLNQHEKTLENHGCRIKQLEER